MNRLILLLMVFLLCSMMMFSAQPPKHTVTLMQPPQFEGDVPQDDFFRKEVLESPVPVLVDFSADWCGPCQELKPELKEMEKRLSGRIRVVEVNVDKNLHLARYYQATALPLIMLFKNGVPVGGFIGLVQAGELVSMVEPHLPQ